MDNVILNKVATVERCLQRIREEYVGHEDELETNFTRQDSILLNLQRACEATIDMAVRVIRIRKLGLPQNSRDAFALLEQARLIDPSLSRNLQAMVGFRNIAVHEYRTLQMPVVRSLIEQRLTDFLAFNRAMLELASLRACDEG